MRPGDFFNMSAEPSRTATGILTTVLFLIGLVGYQYTAYVRHQDNPQDKVVPTIAQLADEFRQVSFEQDRKGQYRLWVDMKASGFRFFSGLGLLSLAIILGLNMGTLPYIERLFYKFVLFVDKIPPLAALPILLITFGVGEWAKVMLIVIGVFPTITLDTYLRAKAVPRQQAIKGFTLGASNAEVIYSIVLPQIWPGVLDTIRLNFKAMILYLIAGEALAATEGMGYRIFVVRRYLAMDTILVYVLIMSLIVFGMDYGVRWWIKRRYSWQTAQ